MSSPSDVRLICTFLSGFTGTAHCIVQYGTDPTYMNLPYSAESTETGTAGEAVSVVLRERLNSLTEYYYTVSAVSGDYTVTIQGNFTTPQYSKCMHDLCMYVLASNPGSPFRIFSKAARQNPEWRAWVRGYVCVYIPGNVCCCTRYFVLTCQYTVGCAQVQLSP